MAAFLNIGLNLALIPSLGMIGAAWATCLSYLSLPVMAYGVSRKYLTVRYEWPQLATLVGGLTVTALVLSWISAAASSVVHLSLSVLLLVAFGVLVVAAVLGKAERRLGVRLLGLALRY